MINNTKFKYLIDMFLVAFLIILGLRVPYLNFIALLLSSWYILRHEKEDILYFLMFLFPFASIFKFTIDSISFFTFLQPLVTMRLLWMEKFCIQKKYGMSIMLLSSYAIILSFSTDLIETVTMLISLLMAALFLKTNDATYEFKTIVEVTSIGIIATSLIAMCSSVFPRIEPMLNEARIKMGAGDYYYRFAGLMGNPNYYTMMVSIALAALCVLITKRKMSILDYGLFGTLSLFGMMSVSKSFIVTYAIMLILLAIINFKEKPQYFLIIIIMFCALGTFLYKFLGDQVISTIVFRFSNDSLNDFDAMTTGRTVYWKEYFDYWKNNLGRLLFGAGIGAANLNGHGSHNFYLEIVYYLGLVGGTLYILCLIRVFQPNKCDRHSFKWYCYLPLIIFLIRGMARNIILSEQLVFLLMICSLSINENDDCEVSGKPPVS